jgi:cell shape-determining protein MreC
MSLTTNDLQQIRKIVEDVVNPLQGEIAALRNDIQEIYDRITTLENKLMPDNQFAKLSLEQKILKLNSELLLAAKQAGISLPR